MKSIQSILVAAVLALSLNAQTTEGWYLGVGLGITSFEDDDYVLDVANLQTGTARLDDDSYGYKVYGGYQFNDIVAIEGAYIDYGEFEYSGTAFLTNQTLEPRSYNLNANLGYDFAQGQVRPFVLLGLAYLDLDNDVLMDDDKVAGFHLGFGLNISPKSLEHITFRILGESDAYSSENKIGKDYSQGLSMFSVGIQYDF